MPTSIRLHALVGAGLLGGSLLLVPGLASAQDDPVPSCSEYTSQLEAQTAFEADPTGLAALDTDDKDQACDEPGVEFADPAPATTTTPPTSATAAPAVSAADDLLARIAALQCGPNYGAESGALSDDITGIFGTERFSEVFGAFTDRTTALNSCIETPTIDDGSTAITSGDQVSVVPEGSAATGEA